MKGGESWFRMSWKNEIKRHWSNFRVPQRIRRKVPSDADDELKNFRSKVSWNYFATKIWFQGCRRIEYLS